MRTAPGVACKPPETTGFSRQFQLADAFIQIAVQRKQEFLLDNCSNRCIFYLAAPDRTAGYWGSSSLTVDGLIINSGEGLVGKIRWEENAGETAK